MKQSKSSILILELQITVKSGNKNMNKFKKRTNLD